MCEGVFQFEYKMTGEKYACKILDRTKLKYSDRNKYKYEA